MYIYIFSALASNSLKMLEIKTDPRMKMPLWFLFLPIHQTVNRGVSCFLHKLLGWKHMRRTAQISSDCIWCRSAILLFPSLWIHTSRWLQFFPLRSTDCAPQFALRILQRLPTPCSWTAWPCFRTSNNTLGLQVWEACWVFSRTFDKTLGIYDEMEQLSIENWMASRNVCAYWEKKKKKFTDSPAEFLNNLC